MASVQGEWLSYQIMLDETLHWVTKTREAEALPDVTWKTVINDRSRCHFPLTVAIRSLREMLNIFVRTILAPVRHLWVRLHIPVLARDGRARKMEHREILIKFEENQFLNSESLIPVYPLDWISVRCYQSPEGIMETLACAVLEKGKNGSLQG